MCPPRPNVPLGEHGVVIPGVTLSVITGVVRDKRVYYLMGVDSGQLPRAVSSGAGTLGIGLPGVVDAGDVTGAGPEVPTVGCPP